MRLDRDPVISSLHRSRYAGPLARDPSDHLPHAPPPKERNRASLVVRRALRAARQRWRPRRAFRQRRCRRVHKDRNRPHPQHRVRVRRQLPLGLLRARTRPPTMTAASTRRAPAASSSPTSPPRTGDPGRPRRPGAGRPRPSRPAHDLRRRAGDRRRNPRSAPAHHRRRGPRPAPVRLGGDRRRARRHLSPRPTLNGPPRVRSAHVRAARTGSGFRCARAIASSRAQEAG